MTDRPFQARPAFGPRPGQGNPLFTHAKLLLGSWVLAEVLLFSLVVHEIGLGGAILLGIITSLIGVTTLRRLGQGAIRTLRASVGGQIAGNGAVLDGTLAALGALLLILPGFVSDLAGLALITPSLRGKLVTRFGGDAPIGGARRPAPPGVIDLEPEEWSVSEPGRH